MTMEPVSKLFSKSKVILQTTKVAIGTLATGLFLEASHALCYASSKMPSTGSGTELIVASGFLGTAFGTAAMFFPDDRNPYDPHAERVLIGAALGLYAGFLYSLIK